MSGGRRFSPKRFRALAFHASEQLAGQATVQDLCNAIWRADFEAYRKLGASITGATWVKTEDGAVPVVKSHPRRSAFEAAGLRWAAVLVDDRPTKSKQLPVPDDDTEATP